MKRLRSVVLLPILFGLPAGALAQTAIGGGICTSSALTGTYEFMLTGRQSAPAGGTSRLFQGAGTAVFDGMSKVTLTLTANTVATTQTFGTALVYSGTYSLQSNCVGSINITTGDTGTFALEAYSISSTTQQAGAFAVIGSDANYAYNGSGNLQPAACPTTLTGVHEFNGTGSTLSGASVTGVLDVAGVLQFDGQGNATANWSQVSNLTATTVNATGTYSLGSPCLATASLTDSAGNKYAVSLSINSASPAFAITVASTQAVFDGSGAATQVATGAACSNSLLSGTYELALGGRQAPGGIVTKILMSDGSATFDGNGKVTFALTANTVNGSQVFGTPTVYSGTYSLQSNCQGTINLTGGDTAALSLVAYSIDATTGQARSFTLVGADATYAFNGGGTVQPAACAPSTLSGSWLFNATGNLLSGATAMGVADIAGSIQFDGQGNATANWTQASNAATTTVSATGTYTVSAACQGSITLTDTASNKYSGAISILGAAGSNLELVVSNPQVLFTGGGRAAFGNPGLAVVNAASFLAGETPAGSVFSIFGSNLATKVGQPTNVPLPTTLQTTSVTVNGEAAPLFYVDANQINAQMPEDIKAGVATVVVKNGNSASNAVAVIVPATGTPGIVVYGSNRAVVVNQDGSINSPSAPAKVGSTVVMYFTGGGPVSASGALVTGAATPSGLSPVTGTSTIKIAGVDAAAINYVGLTPGSIGLYQANFVIPKVAAGDHPVVLTIAGQASNSPVIAVSN